MVRRRSNINTLRKQFEEHYSFVSNHGGTPITELTDIIPPSFKFSRNPKFDHHLSRQLECAITKLLAMRRTIVTSSSGKHAIEDQDLGGPGTTSITDLPDYILMDIYARLPLKSVCRCRCVCKDWSVILLNPDFIKLKLERSSVCLLLRNYCTEQNGIDISIGETETHPSRDISFFEYESGWRTDSEDPSGNLILHTVFKLPWEYRFCPKPIVNSCNGFVCLHGLQSEYPTSPITQFCESTHYCPELIDKYVVAIYNPITAEYSILPIPEDDVSVCGLGFCSSSNQYKVLLMRNLKSNCNSCDTSSICSNKVAMVFSLRLDKRCRRIETPQCFECCSNFEPVYLNGTLYWLVRDFDNGKGIMSFDFENEKFRLLPSPPLTCLTNTIEDRARRCLYATLADSFMTLGTVRGNLCLSISVSIFRYDIWVMKGYDMDKAWIKEYTLDSFDSGRCLSPELNQITDQTNNWDLLLYSTKRKFIYFIDKHQAIRYFKIEETTPNLEVSSYVPSYLSLKDIVGDSLNVLKVKST